jgi:hypothetical protein
LIETAATEEPDAKNCPEQSSLSEVPENSDKVPENADKVPEKVASAAPVKRRRSLSNGIVVAKKLRAEETSQASCSLKSGLWISKSIVPCLDEKLFRSFF